MAKRNTTKAPQIEIEEHDAGDEAPAPRSVVKAAYKQKYAERAKAGIRGAGSIPKRALKRSANDWLALELGKRVLDEHAKLVVPKLEAILEANGVEHAKWNRTTRGWEGRLRMTGRLALQRVVAESGELIIPGEGAISAPKAWVTKYAN